MTGHDPDEVIAEAERRADDIAQHAMPAVEWFLEEVGLYRRGDAVDQLADPLASSATSPAPLSAT